MYILDTHLNINEHCFNVHRCMFMLFNIDFSLCVLKVACTITTCYRSQVPRIRSQIVRLCMPRTLSPLCANLRAHARHVFPPRTLRILVFIHDNRNVRRAYVIQRSEVYIMFSDKFRASASLSKFDLLDQDWERRQRGTARVMSLLS